MKLIELSSGCERLDSVVEANEKGDKKALVAALEANIATMNSILTAAQSVKDRYTPTLLDLIWDLEKAHKLRDGQTNDRA